MLFKQMQKLYALVMFPNMPLGNDFDVAIYLFLNFHRKFGVFITK